MIVLKFGGTSVGTPDTIRQVAHIIKQKVDNGDRIISVFSAFGGVTNELLRLMDLATHRDAEYIQVLQGIEKRHHDALEALFDPQDRNEITIIIKDLLNELDDLCRGIYLIGESSPKIADLLVGFGERLSSPIVAHLLKTQGVDAQWLDSRTVLKTDANHGNARVLKDETEKAVFKHMPKDAEAVVLPGFIASTVDGETTTLGRGGSDYSASVLARAVQADTLEIWTDVSGIYSSDPRVVKDAVALERVSYEEAMELSHFGAKVIYAPTIQPVREKQIPTYIKNTFEPHMVGTVINDTPQPNEPNIKGITSLSDMSSLSLFGPEMVGESGFVNRTFDVLSRENIMVILITQCSSEHSITLVISTKDSQRAKQALEQEFEREIERKKLTRIEVKDGLAVVAVVGDNMTHNIGVAGKALSVLGDGGINLIAIAQGSSEKNISVVVNDVDRKKSLNLLHERFFGKAKKTLHVFLAGIGNVGGELIRQIRSNKASLLEKYHAEIKVIGAMNSKKMKFNPDGLNLDDISSDIANGQAIDHSLLVEYLAKYNMRNMVFVDNTASESLVEIYPKLLRQQVGVVASNKYAMTQDREPYATLQESIAYRGAQFRYEANVGAGLPIIQTLKQMVRTADNVTKIQALLSGSLNYIFSQINSGTPFSQAVEQAKELGYTEPHPAADLSGMDLARKGLILARILGAELDIHQASVEPVVDVDESLTATQYLSELKQKDAAFDTLAADTKADHKQLKYYAEITPDSVIVKMGSFDASHPFSRLEGTDSMVLIYSDYYTQPLTIQGAGAGKEVTAQGVYNDILMSGLRS